MASSSNQLNLGAPPSEKLTRTNYPIWRAQILPAIRGAQQVGLLDGSDAAPAKLLPQASADKEKEPSFVPNPEYATWLVRDQIVLSYLLNGLSPEIMTHVLRHEHTAAVWKAIESMFASVSQSKITNLRVALANTKKLNKTTSEFLTQMQRIADELAAAGRPVPEDEHVSFILAGLGADYNSLVAALGMATVPISLSDLYAHINAYDERQLMLRGQPASEFETSANLANKQ
jgi:hypothetical protein